MTVRRIALGLAALWAAFLYAPIALAQSPVSLCIPDTSVVPNRCAPVTVSNPLPTSASGGGTGAVNLTQILGAAPSATNPLWVSPATGAIFPASQSGSWTVAATQSGTWTVTPTAGTGVGSSTAGAIVPNNTTAVVVKASAGTLYGAQLAGLGSAPAYVKIYNATSATCGSGTPVKRLMIPAASTAANGAGSNISFGPVGVAFGTGITYCVTTGIADNDTTAPAASTFLVNLDYQ